MTMNIQQPSLTPPSAWPRHRRVVSTSSLRRTVAAGGTKRPRDEEQDGADAQPKKNYSDPSLLSTHRRESLSHALRKRLRLCQENGLVSGKPTEKVARCLEQHFLRSDSLTTEHVDTDTDLNERLRGLLGSVLQRCLAKELAAGPNRIQDFERVLGKAKVQQIADVCDEIEKAKLNQCNTCSGGACSARPRSRDGQLSLAGEIPMAVRNLYFGTKLPTLWDSQDGVDSLAPAEWDQHYEVAVKHLEAYRAFVGAQSSA